MAATALHRFIVIGESLGDCLEVAAGTVCVVGLGNRTWCMTAKTGMILNFKEFIVSHHPRIITVIMTLGTVERACFVFLCTGVTAPTRGGLVIVSCLLMTG